MSLVVFIHRHFITQQDNMVSVKVCEALLPIYIQSLASGLYINILEFAQPSIKTTMDFLRC